MLGDEPGRVRLHQAHQHVGGLGGRGADLGLRLPLGEGDAPAGQRHRRQRLTEGVEDAEQQLLAGHLPRRRDARSAHRRRVHRPRRAGEQRPVQIEERSPRHGRTVLAASWHSRRRCAAPSAMSRIRSTGRPNRAWRPRRMSPRLGERSERPERSGRGHDPAPQPPPASAASRLRRVQAPTASAASPPKRERPRFGGSGASQPGTRCIGGCTVWVLIERIDGGSMSLRSVCESMHVLP